jgi:hypothetical protein
MKSHDSFKVKSCGGFLKYAAFMAGILFFSQLFIGPASAGIFANPCKKTAQDILMSCKLGVYDEYYIARATCDNLPSGADQKSCLQQARDNKKAGIEECKNQYNARLDICKSLGGGAYHPTIDPADFTTKIDNPNFTLTPGTTFVYEGTTENGFEHDEVTVTSDTKTILGVTCVVVKDTVTADGELIEDTLDWYAQDKQGNVWYFGENAKQYAGGLIVGIEGSWEAGVNGAQPGIVMEANPKVGDIYRQEFAPGEAEDMAEVLSLTEPTTVPFGSYPNCLMTKEFSGLEPDVTEHKFYANGVGFIKSIDVGTNFGIDLVGIIKK